MDPNGYKLFNEFVSKIIWTENHPKPGILFADISGAIGHASFKSLMSKVCVSRGIQKGHVILGIPTRGNYIAPIIGSCSDGSQTVFFHKEGVGTSLPNTVPLCDSNTVYSGEKKTNFLIRSEDVDVIQRSDVVWIVDDVCESGNTFLQIYKSVKSLSPNAVVRCLPFLTFSDSPASKKGFFGDLPEDIFMPICVYDREKGFVLPGKRLFSDPSILFTLRGPTALDNLNANRGHVKVYGPPSMWPLMLEFCSSETRCVIGDIQWNQFAGGMPNIQFEQPTAGHIVFFFDASWSNQNQIGVVHALARNCMTMTVVIPYFPAGTMERVEKEGTLATAQTQLHALCSGMPKTSRGIVDLIIYDIHQTGTRFYVGNKVRYVSQQFLPQVVPKPEEVGLQEKDNIIIVFPDDGAAKRFKHLFLDGKQKKTLYVCSKIREGEKRKIQISEQIGPDTMVGATVVIVDDLVRTGGTILETAEICRKMGAKTVAAAFVHADFDNGYFYKFVSDPRLDYIFCSNTNPRKSQLLLDAAISKGFKNKVVIKSLFEPHGFSCERSCATLASSSEEKLEALRNSIYYVVNSPFHDIYTTKYYGIWCGAAPSYVDEQPFGKKGEKGCTNRLLGLTYLSMPNCYAIESYLSLENCEAEEYVTDEGFVHGVREGVCAMFSSNLKDSKNVVFQNVKVLPDVLNVSLKDESKTVGSLLQRKYNLATASDWLSFFGEQKEGRVQMLQRAFENL